MQDEGEEEEKQTKPEVHQDGDATQQPIKAKKKKKKKKEDKRTIQLMEVFVGTVMTYIILTLSTFSYKTPFCLMKIVQI